MGEGGKKRKKRPFTTGRNGVIVCVQDNRIEELTLLLKQKWMNNIYGSNAKPDDEVTFAHAFAYMHSFPDKLDI